MFYRRAVRPLFLNYIIFRNELQEKSSADILPKSRLILHNKNVQNADKLLQNGYNLIKRNYSIAETVDFLRVLRYIIKE